MSTYIQGLREYVSIVAQGPVLLQLQYAVTYYINKILKCFVQPSPTHLRHNTQVAASDESRKQATAFGCERFTTFVLANRDQRRPSETCRAKVLPLVLKLCNASIRSLRAIAGNALAIGEEWCAEQVACLLPMRLATRDMQISRSLPAQPQPLDPSMSLMSHRHCQICSKLLC